MAKWKNAKEENIAYGQEMAQAGVNVTRAGREQGNLTMEQEGQRMINDALEHIRIWKTR